MRELEPYYRVGEPFYYNHVKSMMALSTTFALNEPNLPRAVWDKDRFGKEELVYRGHRIQVDIIGKAVEESLAKATEILMVDILDTENYDEFFPKFDPKIIMDDLTNNSNGYSFLHQDVNPVFANLERNLLQHLLMKLGQRGEEDQQAYWHMWCKSVKTFIHHLLVAFHLSSGLPGRGGEVCGLLVENTEVRTRNLFYLFGGLVVIHQYNKTSHNRGIEKTIAKKLYPPVADLLLLYLTVIRPVELLVAPKLLMHLKARDPESILESLCTKMWASPLKGEMLSSDLSNHIASAFLGLTSARLTLNEYRHVAIIMLRKLIKHHGFQDNQLQQFLEIADLQAGHTHQTSEDHYGLLTNQMALEMTDNELAVSVGVSIGAEHSQDGIMTLFISDQ